MSIFQRKGDTKNVQKLSLRSRGKYETKPSGKGLWTRMNNKVRDFLASMCFSGPSFLGMLAFYIIPFLIVVYYSFTAGLTDHSFAGLKNYINVWQNGAFKIAQKANVPIVICALVNSKAILKNMFRRHTDVYLDVLAVIPPEELEGLKTIDIGDRAHGILLEGLRKRKAALAAQ